MTDEQDQAHEQAAADRLAAKIERLFEAVHPPERGPYSNNEVADWLGKTADQGPTISANYLRYLRNGERRNPGASQLRAIARFFEVDPGYLLAEDAKTQEIHDQLLHLSYLRNAVVRGIAARAAGLDDQTQEWLLNLVDTMPNAGGSESQRRRGRSKETGGDDTSAEQ